MKKILLLFSLLFAITLANISVGFGSSEDIWSPEKFSFEVSADKWIISPNLSLSFDSINTIGLGADFLYPVSKLWLSFGYNYITSMDTTLAISEIPFGVHYYQPINTWLKMKIGAVSGINLTAKTMAISSNKLSWTMLFML